MDIFISKSSFGIIKTFTKITPSQLLFSILSPLRIQHHHVSSESLCPCLELHKRQNGQDLKMSANHLNR